MSDPDDTDFVCQRCGRHLIHHVAYHDAQPADAAEGVFEGPAKGFYCCQPDYPSGGATAQLVCGNCGETFYGPLGGHSCRDPRRERAEGCTVRGRGTMSDYPVETLNEDDDDGTMPANVAILGEAVIGRRIVSVEKTKVGGRWYGEDTATVITLDNGRRVVLADTVDHMILGVGTTDGYTTWHIFADFGDVMKLTVGWSCGNPFYYSYGFDIRVVDAPEQCDDSRGGEE